MSKFKSPTITNPSQGKWLVFAEDEVSITNAEILGTSYFGFGSGFRGGLIRSYVQVGRYSRIGRGVSLGLGNHDMNNTSIAGFFAFPPSGTSRGFAAKEPKRRVIIGNDVWIGDGVRINTGVTIGNGAIIGAGAFVNKDVAPYEIVGGLPAKHLRWRFEEPIRNALEEIAWWQFDPAFLKEHLSADPFATIEFFRGLDTPPPPFNGRMNRVTPDSRFIR
ncbi:CatB-related O-acetyltransferase [Corynebacterium casei]|uniref:CatB-related O-acetyltransferase n=1 Tax=Corynebacterium casei TaxID=160386 RepID=UPI003FD4A275